MVLRSLQSEIFTALLFDESPTLGEVIKEIGWGSNRDIYQRGFRIDSEFSEEAPFFSKRVKSLPVIKDHRLSLSDNTAVMSLNGRELVVVRITKG